MKQFSRVESAARAAFFYARPRVFRELLQSEEFKFQQASVEQELGSLRQSLQNHISAAHNLTSGLQARLEDIQEQVTQVTSGGLLESLCLFFMNSQLNSHLQVVTHIILKAGSLFLFLSSASPLRMKFPSH